MLRTIQGAYEEIAKDDPQTPIRPYTIRKWCKEGKIRFVQSGNKIFVDVQSLKNYINNSN